MRPVAFNADSGHSPVPLTKTYLGFMDVPPSLCPILQQFSGVELGVPGDPPIFMAKDISWAFGLKLFFPQHNMYRYPIIMMTDRSSG